MRDVQNESDDRNLAIDRVGISGISWPISVPDRENGVQETVAEVSLSVSLPQDYRGTHMSRFIEVLSAQEKKVTFHNMEGLLASLKERLHAEDAHAVFDFPYFITKSAPVSGSRGRVRCDVRFDAAMLGGDFDLSSLLSVDGSLNYGQITDENYQTYINSFLAADDLTRDNACLDMLRYIATNAPIIPVCFERHEVITHRNVITGMEVTNTNVFYNISDWTIKFSDEGDNS